jgi:hypothetical protein
MDCFHNEALDLPPAGFCHADKFDTYDMNDPILLALNEIGARPDRLTFQMHGLWDIR